MAPPAAPAPVPRKRVNKCSPAFINDMWELHTGLYRMDAGEKTLFVRAGGTPGALESLATKSPERRGAAGGGGGGGGPTLNRQSSLAEDSRKKARAGQ